MKRYRRKIQKKKKKIIGETTIDRTMYNIFVIIAAAFVRRVSASVTL